MINLKTGGDWLDNLHFLQTDAWATFQRALGHDVIQKQGKGWSYLAIVEHGQLSRRLYCPYGPTAVNTQALQLALDDLAVEAKVRRLDFVRVEPRRDLVESHLDNDLPKLGLRRAIHNVQPADTVINFLVDDNDGGLSDEEILAACSQTDRRIYRKLQGQNINYRLSSDPADIEHFLPMIHGVAERTNMRPMPDEYFREIAKTLFPMDAAGIMIAEKDSQPIAAIIFYVNEQMMIYAHAAASDEHRKQSPATGLAMSLLMEANRRGCKIFDFHGIAPQGAPTDHRWVGFSHFKLSFGGEATHFCGTWELPISRLKYSIESRLIKLNKKK